MRFEVRVDPRAHCDLGNECLCTEASAERCEFRQTVMVSQTSESLAGTVLVTALFVVGLLGGVAIMFGG